MTNIYKNDAYKSLFDLCNEMQAKLEALQIQEGEIRTALGHWQPATRSQASAFERAHAALTGAPARDDRGDGLREMQAEHLAVKLAIHDLEQGLPEARARLERMRSQLIHERLGQADVQKVLKRSAAAARALSAADREVNELLDALSTSGFGMGVHDREVMVLDQPAALEHWAQRLEQVAAR